MELVTALLFSESHRARCCTRIAVSGFGRKPILLLGSNGPISCRQFSSVHADRCAHEHNYTLVFTPCQAPDDTIVNTRVNPLDKFKVKYIRDIVFTNQGV